MSNLPTKRPSGALTARDDDAETVYSVLQSVTRLGAWDPPETMRLVSVLGNIVLDYRDADLPLGVTTVECEVYLGNIEIIVPPDVDIELEGSVFLGNVDAKDSAPEKHLERLPRDAGGDGEPDPHEDDEDEWPVLVIDCSGLMGNVEVKRS
jgi:hypothetical protein